MANLPNCEQCVSEEADFLRQHLLKLQIESKNNKLGLNNNNLYFRRHQIIIRESLKLSFEEIFTG